MAIRSSAQEEADIAKILFIAESLSASVVGDDGEKYQLRKRLFDKERIVTA